MKKMLIILSFLVAVKATFADSSAYVQIFCIQENALGSFLERTSALLQNGDLMKVTIIKSECKPGTGDSTLGKMKL